MSDRLSVGFIGLGKMGGPMAARLVAKGHEVSGFDPAPDAVDRLAQVGGHACDSAPAAAARIIILVLPDSDVVESVLFHSGLAERLPRGAIVVDMSSSSPLRTRKVAERLLAKGIRLVDAPVSGGVAEAVDGRLTVMLGADKVDAKEVSPLLASLGQVRHVGPVGAGHALKALNNLLSAAHLWVTSEAVLVGERFGLDPQTMLETINGSSGRSGSTENKWPNFVLNGNFNSGFGLALMLKDMRIATDLARNLGVPIQLGDAATNQWSQAAAVLKPDADHTEIVRWLRHEAAVGPVA